MYIQSHSLSHCYLLRNKKKIWHNKKKLRPLAFVFSKKCLRNRRSIFCGLTRNILIKRATLRRKQNEDDWCFSEKNNIFLTNHNFSKLCLLTWFWSVLSIYNDVKYGPKSCISSKKGGWPRNIWKRTVLTNQGYILDLENSVFLSSWLNCVTMYADLHKNGIYDWAYTIKPFDSHWRFH